MSNFKTVHELMTSQANGFADYVLTAYKKSREKDSEASDALHFIKFHMAMAKTVMELLLQPPKLIQFVLGMVSFALLHTEPELLESFKQITPEELDTVRDEAAKSKSKRTNSTVNKEADNA